MFSIDGLTWDVPCTVERTANITPSEISGMLLDKSYFNDVLGTYMEYTVQVAVPFGREDDWNTIYEALTAPVDGHTCVFPYNGSTINITGRVESVQDGWVRMPQSHNYWKAIRFTVISNAPSKTMSLSQVIARGRSPLPEIATAQVGDLVECTANGWVPAEYGDADTTSY